MKERNRITARDSDTTPAKRQAGFGRNDARRNAQRNTQQRHLASRAPSPSERVRVKNIFSRH
jgi:hypothetical protein